MSDAFNDWMKAARPLSASDIHAFYVPRWPCVDYACNLGLEPPNDAERVVEPPKSWSPNQVELAQIIGRPSKKEWRAFMDEYGVSAWLRDDEWFKDDDCYLDKADIEKFEQRKSAWLRPQDELLRSCKPNIAPRESLFQLDLICSGAPGMTLWYGWEAISLTPDLALITTNAEAFEYSGPEWLPAEINGLVPRNSLSLSTALLLKRHGVDECFPSGWGFFSEDFWEIEAAGLPKAEIYRILLSFWAAVPEEVLSMPAEELVHFRQDGMNFDYKEL